VNTERDYYHISWTEVDESGNEKSAPLAVTADDDEERVVLVFDSFDRAKRYMHTFLVKKGIVDRRQLAQNTAVVTVLNPVLGSTEPGHIFSVGEKNSADVLARASRKSSVNYALLNPGPLDPALVKRSRVPLEEL
jgi:hypothetical protein